MVIARWNGNQNDVTVIGTNSALVNPADGDVIVHADDGSGNMVMKLNGSTITTATNDTTFTGGRPWLGFDVGAASATDVTIKAFTATDGVFGAPLILSQPTDKTVDAFTSASFTVSASSQSGTTLSYQWAENASNISNATNASLLINPTAQSDQNGVITVSVWDVNGTTGSNSAILRINFNGGYYLQEVDTSSKFSLEDASGFYLLEGWSTSAAGGFFPPFYWGDLDGIARRFFGDRLN